MRESKSSEMKQAGHLTCPAVLPTFSSETCSCALLSFTWIFQDTKCIVALSTRTGSAALGSPCSGLQAQPNTCQQVHGVKHSLTPISQCKAGDGGFVTLTTCRRWDRGQGRFESIHGRLFGQSTRPAEVRKSVCQAQHRHNTQQNSRQARRKKGSPN